MFYFLFDSHVDAVRDQLSRSSEVLQPLGGSLHSTMMNNSSRVSGDRSAVMSEDSVEEGTQSAALWNTVSALLAASVEPHAGQPPHLHLITWFAAGSRLSLHD